MATNVLCPHCQARLNVSETVRSRTFVCPHCLTEMDNPQTGAIVEAPNLLRDIRQDSRTTGGVLWILVGLCITGILFIFLFGLASQGNSAWVVPLMIGFGVLDILVFMAISRPLWRSVLGGSEEVSVPRMAFRVVGMLLLTVALGMAIVIFFFAVCLAMVAPLSR